MKEKIKFLDRVKISNILVRKHGVRKEENKYNSRNCKYWEEKKIPETTATFLGFRTLSNGINDFDSECGIIYCATDYVSAALVVFNEREKPVYVAIKELKKSK